MGNRRDERTKVCNTCGSSYHPWANRFELSRFCSRRCWSWSKRGPQVVTHDYKILHTRVYALRGRASDWPCSSGCGSRAAEWACVGEYESTDDYVPLCHSCHRKFDYRKARGLSWASRLTVCINGHSLSEHWKSGHCSACSRDATARYRARKAAE